MLVCLVTTLMLQPEPAAAPVRDPAPYLAEFCETNQREGIRDRVLLTSTDNEGNGQSIEVVLRRTPAGENTSTRIDFPSVSFYHADGKLFAERNSETKKAVVYMDTTAGGFLEAMSAVMPAIPMPQLWTLQADGSVIDPALGELQFTAADVNVTEVILTGSSTVGEVTLVIDTDSHKAVWFEAALRDGVIRADYTRVSREDPATWAIPTEGRWVVSRLSQLALSGPPLEIGQTFNDLDLLTPDYEGISLSELQGMEQVRRSGPWVVLLIVSSEADKHTFDLAERIAAGVWSRSAQEVAAVNEDDVLRYWLGHRTFIIAVSPDLGILPDKVAQIAELAPEGVPLLISTEPEHTLDRLETEMPIVAVLVDPHRTVGAVLPIETAETGISAVLKAMRSYTRMDAEGEPEGPLMGSE